jgi:uncharacterized protein (TIGR02145 family)
MRKNILTLSLLLAAICALNAQTIMNIHQSNGTVLQIPLNTIDSITYSGIGGSGIVSNPGPGVTFNGYTYSTIILGNGQEWMAENLRTANYANGDPITNVTDSFLWSSLTTGAWVNYNNDSQYENPYGKLYNWYTVVDPRNVCPSGWHVPTDAEWYVLINYLGGVSVAGYKMKSTGTQYWLSPNPNDTNESGFSGLPGGRIYSSWPSEFVDIGQYGHWWSSTTVGNTNAWSHSLNYDGNVSHGSPYMYYGQSVRCLKN